MLFRSGGFASCGRWAEAGLLAAVILAGAGVYGMLLWIFRIQGREELLAMLRRRGAREG